MQYGLCITVWYENFIVWGNKVDGFTEPWVIKWRRLFHGIKLYGYGTNHKTVKFNSM